MRKNEHTSTETYVDQSLDCLIEGYQLISFEWKYLYVNKAVVEQSKYPTKEDLIGFTMMEKFPGIEQSDLFKTLKECMESRVSKNMLNEFRFPDNSKGWFELRMEPVPSGVFILSLDVTDRIRAEDVRKTHLKNLEDMLYMTSHKLRQPICNVKGISEVIDNIQNISSSEFKKLVKQIKTEVENMDLYSKEIINFLSDKKKNPKGSNNS